MITRRGECVNDTTVLIGAISALASALAVVAKAAYAEMKAERDYLRSEVLTALTAIVTKAAQTTEERDRMIRELTTKIDNVRRLLTRGGGGK